MQTLLWLNNPRLKTRSEPVKEINQQITQCIQTMFDTIDVMQDNSLAAIQLGMPLRIIVLDLMREEGTRFREAMINPEIIAASAEKQAYTEFCSSIPQHQFPTQRAKSVTVRYQAVTGEFHTIEATGIFAVCLQHEIDHLDGILISDSLSVLKQNRIKTQLAKLKRT